MDFPISRAQFKQWLDERNDADIVGESATATFCPLARACHALTDYSQLRILVYTWKRSPKGRDNPLPKWAQQFVLGVDGGTDEINAPVSAATARVILTEIPE